MKKERKIIRKYKGTFFIAEYITKYEYIFEKIEGEAYIFEGNQTWTIIEKGNKKIRKKEIYYAPYKGIPKYVDDKFKEINKIKNLIKEHSQIIKTLKSEKNNIEETLTQRDHLKNDLNI